MPLAKDEYRFEMQYLLRLATIPSSSAILLYLYLRTYSNNKNKEAYPSWKTIVEDLNIDFAYMYRVKQKLVNAGLIKLRTETTDQNINYTVHQMIELPQNKDYIYIDRNNKPQNPFTDMRRNEIIELAKKNLAHLPLMIYLSARFYKNGISWAILRKILNNKQLRKCRICAALDELTDKSYVPHIRFVDLKDC